MRASTLLVWLPILHSAWLLRTGWMGLFPQLLASSIIPLPPFSRPCGLPSRPFSVLVQGLEDGVSGWHHLLRFVQHVWLIFLGLGDPDSLRRWLLILCVSAEQFSVPTPLVVYITPPSNPFPRAPCQRGGGGSSWHQGLGLRVLGGCAGRA